MERKRKTPISQSPAMVLRAGLRQARLDELGGEALDNSGFENETPEPGFWERE